MRVLQAVCTAMIVLALGGLATAAEKEKKSPDKDKPQETVHSVTASVDYPTNGGVGVQAEKKPGEFTIPKGSKGAKLKYSFFNPKSGNTLTKLNGRNVYSVTEHRYMEELDKNPDFELPPGDYKFVVGGEPGATGTLTYTTIPSKSDDTTTKTRPPKDTTKDTSKDKPKTGTERDPLHPGGEGKRKVTVFKKGTREFTDSAAKDTHLEGPVDGVLTIAGDSFTIEFPLATAVPNIKTFSETWKGQIAKQGQTLSVSGAVQETVIYASGGYIKGPGTFQGTFDGDRLSGTLEKKGEWDGGWGDGPKPFRETLEWSIKGLGMNR